MVKGTSENMNETLRTAGYNSNCRPLDAITRFAQWFDRLSLNDDPRVAEVISGLEWLHGGD